MAASVTSKRHVSGDLHRDRDDLSLQGCELSLASGLHLLKLGGRAFGAGCGKALGAGSHHFVDEIEQVREEEVEKRPDAGALQAMAARAARRARGATRRAIGGPMA